MKPCTYIWYKSRASRKSKSRAPKKKKDDDVERSRAPNLKRKNDDDVALLDDESADKKRQRASRYERNSSSAIYMAFNKFKAFRRTVTAQLLILMRDGYNLRNGATDRRLNVAAIVEAAKKYILYADYCRLEDAFKGINLAKLRSRMSMTRKSFQVLFVFATPARY